mmetsp:Transcript_65474/g.206923  ORF Transcript_65474/g.206923 Transcript_65474/m.206923 type:complete len:320 (+) Transcript_65474:151-1110(+)
MSLALFSIREDSRSPCLEELLLPHTTCASLELGLERDDDGDALELALCGAGVDVRGARGELSCSLQLGGDSPPLLIERFTPPYARHAPRPAAAEAATPPSVPRARLPSPAACSTASGAAAPPAEPPAAAVPPPESNSLMRQQEVDAAFSLALSLGANTQLFTTPCRHFACLLLHRFVTSPLSNQHQAVNLRYLAVASLSIASKLTGQFPPADPSFAGRRRLVQRHGRAKALRGLLLRQALTGATAAQSASPRPATAGTASRAHSRTPSSPCSRAGRRKANGRVAQTDALSSQTWPRSSAGPRSSSSKRSSSPRPRPNPS